MYNWNPPKGNPAIEIFLSKLEIFPVWPGTPPPPWLESIERKMVRNERLSEDWNIITKPADKGSCVVVWDRQDYIAGAVRQLKDNETYESSSLKGADLIKFCREK